MSIATLIDEQLPIILSAEDPTEGEEAVGEPAETWWNTFSKLDSIFVLDSAWTLGRAIGGTLTLRYRTSHVGEIELRSLCTQVTDNDGATLAQWDHPLPVEFEDAPQLRVSWVRLKSELFPTNALECFRSAMAEVGDVPIIRLNGRIHAKIFVAVFPTEITHGKTGDSWVLFIISGARRDLIEGNEKKLTYATARTLRAGVQDVARRAPASAILRGCHVIVVGVGAIGAPVVLELARNGVDSITVVDGDRVTPGNGIRWPFAESAWGRRKVTVLSERVREEHASTTVNTIPHMLGELDIDASDGIGAQLRAALKQADAVIDASTAFDALSIVAERCREARIPLISVNATPSLEGGAVARFMASGGCPTCLVLHQQSSPPTMPSPPGELGDPMAIAIPGCAEATFAGSSYDLGELSFEAVRLLARTLSSERASSIVETLSFEGPDRLPAWRVDQLDLHASCGCQR